MAEETMCIGNLNARLFEDLLYIIKLANVVTCHMLGLFVAFLLFLLFSMHH